MDIQRILVVCVGNICRSPMAEYLLKSKLPDRQIVSAGISGMVGYPADDKALICMDRLHINMHDHVAQKLTGDMIKQADLVLVMSTGQQKHLEQTWSFAKGKTFRLGHWQNKDVADPYQHEQAVFDQTCRDIECYVDDWCNKI